MRIGPGPVLKLEMRRLGRRWQTYAWRVATVGALLGIVAACWAMQPNRPAVVGLRDLAALGQNLFWFLAVAKLSTALFVAPAVSGDVLIPARKRGTLFHMFLSDLSSGEIVLGAYCGKLVAAVQPLIAAAPVTFAIVLFGGVHPNHVLNLYLLLAAVVVLVPAACVLLSLWLTRVAELLAVVFLALGLWCGMPLFHAILFGRFLAPPAPYFAEPLVRRLAEWSPFPLLVRGLGAHGQTWDGVAETALFALASAGVAAAMLAVAAWRLRPAALSFADRPAERPTGRWRRLRFRGREPDLDARPVLWLEWARHRGNLVTLLNSALIGAGGIGAACLAAPALFERPYQGLVPTVFLVAATVAASQALALVAIAGQVGEDRQSRHFEMLATTTLDPVEILRDRGAHARGMLRAGWFLLVFFVAALGWTRAYVGATSTPPRTPTMTMSDYGAPGPWHGLHATFAVAMAVALGYGWGRLSAALAVWGALRFRTPFRGLVVGVATLAALNVGMFLVALGMIRGTRSVGAAFLLLSPCASMVCCGAVAIDSRFPENELTWFGTGIAIPLGFALVGIARRLDRRSAAWLEARQRDATPRELAQFRACATP